MNGRVIPGSYLFRLYVCFGQRRFWLANVILERIIFVSRGITVYLTSRSFPSNTLVAGPLIHKPAIGYDPEIIPVAFHPHSLFAQDPYEFYPIPILVQILQLFFASLISATHSTHHSLLYFTVQTMLGDVLHHSFAVY